MTNQHLTTEIEALIKKHYGGYAAEGNPRATFLQSPKSL